MYYAIDISHKKEPEAKSFVTIESFANSEIIKEELQKALNINIDNIKEIDKNTYELCYVSIAQGMMCLRLCYKEIKYEKIKNFLNWRN